MEEAISKALASNNQIHASRYAVKKAGWDRKNAWSLLLPVLSMNSQMTWIDDETFALRDFRRYLPEPLKSEIPQTVFQTAYYTSLDVTVPLFNASLLNNLSIAYAGHVMAVQMDKSTRQNIIFQVVSSYLNVIKSKDVLQLQAEFLELSRMNFEKAQRLQNAGRYSKTDVLRWKVDYQQQKSLVVQNESLLRSSLSHLNRLLNIDMSENIEVEGQIPKRLLKESERLETCADEEILKLIEIEDVKLIQANAALSAAESNTKTSKLLYRNGYTNYLPSVSASYSYGWRENNTLALVGCR